MNQSKKDPVRWIINSQLEFPDELLSRASKNQASLSKGLGVLRAIRFGFPRTIEPQTAQQWIDSGGKIPK